MSKKTNAAVEATKPITSNDASRAVTLELGAEEIVGAILGAPVAVAPTAGGRGIAVAGGGGGITPLGGGGGIAAPAGLFNLSLGASPSEGGGGGGGGGVSRLIVYQLSSAGLVVSQSVSIRFYIL